MVKEKGSSVIHDGSNGSSDWIISESSFHTWNDAIFDRFKATFERPRRRALVTAGCGITLYLVGLLIADAGGFLTLYERTPLVYLMAFYIAFMMGRQKWAKAVVFRYISETRDVFLISDEEFTTEIEKIGRKLTRTWPHVILFTIGMAVGVGALAITEKAPKSALGMFLYGLTPPTLPTGWQSGPSLQLKAVVLLVYLAAFLFTMVHVVYGSSGVILNLPLIAGRWNVVPVPSVVAVKLRNLSIFYHQAALVYAIGLLWIVVIYEGRFSIPFALGIGFFALGGLLCVTLPSYTTTSAVKRSTDQIATALARQYRQDLFPFASGQGAKDGSAYGKDSTDYTVLVKMQELMATCATASQSILWNPSVIPALLSQAIPFLGFLYPVISHAVR